MNKTLLTLAVASSLAVAGAVQAETKVYGHAQVEIGSHGGDANEGMSLDDKARGRFGIKNSEDLGDGLSSIATFEFKVDTADGDAGTSGNGQGISVQKRTMMIGLKGGFGQVELGRLKSAYKYYGGVKYDPFVATLLQARGAAGMSSGAYGHNSFISDSIGYQKKMGAISFRVTYDLDDGGPAVAAVGANAMTLGVKFKSGKTFEAGLAIVDDGKVTGAYSATKLFGMYNLGGAGKIKLQIESSEVDGGGAAAEKDYTYLNYNFKLSKAGMIDVAIGTEDTTGTDRDFTRIAYAHNLSKKTRLTVGYASTGTTPLIGAETSKDVIAFGIRKKF